VICAATTEVVICTDNDKKGKTITIPHDDFVRHTVKFFCT